MKGLAIQGGLMQRHAPAATLAAAFLFSMAFAALPARGLPNPKDEWIEVRTASFTLFSNAGARTTQRIGADLERLRSALSELSPGLLLSSPYPTSIFVFKNGTSFEPYQHLYDGRPKKVAGYFLSVPQGNYVAINGDPRNDRTTFVVYHEYLHYVLRNNYASLPLWLNEGLAELYSTFQVSSTEAKIGLPIREHVLWLRKNPLIPLPELFAVDEKSKQYNEGSRLGAFYAQSWALVHYLFAGSPERRQQAVRYLQLLQGDVPAGDAFRQAFGEAVGLDRELKTYVQSYIFNYTTAPIQAEADLKIETRPMTWPDVLYRLGDLAVNVGPAHHALATEHFRAALAAQPDHGPATAGLGYVAELGGRKAEALAHYEKAAKLAPDDFLVQYLYGRMLLRDPEPAPEAQARARAALRRSVELRPGFGEAWARLGYVLSMEEPPSPQTIPAMEKAHELLPSRMEVAHNLALAYAHGGQRQKAEELIERVLAPHAEPEVVATAREALLDDDHRRAEELIGLQKLEEAVPLLENVREKTVREERRVRMEQRLEAVRHTLEYNRFIDLYNEAIRFSNQGKREEAIAILEPLVETAKIADQAEQARTLLTRLRELQRKK
jgi:tetratricopeptide (TPR) repeat protein